MADFKDHDYVIEQVEKSQEADHDQREKSREADLFTSARDGL